LEQSINVPIGVENDERLGHGPILSDRVAATIAVQAASRATGDKAGVPAAKLTPAGPERRPPPAR
jgi:hypothetical protein